MSGNGFRLHAHIAALIFFLLTQAALARPALESTDLPACIDAPDTLAEIERVQRAQRKTPQKYDGFRSALDTVNPVELAARLAYAETLAANCPAQQTRIADLITAVIGNRIRLRGGDIGSVAFQRDQFASSLNVYAESRYRDFLCPRDRDLWRRVLSAMQANLDGPAADVAIPRDTVNYYLYRHSDRFKPPAWGLQEAGIADNQLRECIRAFRNPAWR